MDLILWRHADAEDGSPDMARSLTEKGQKLAEACKASPDKDIISVAEKIYE